MQSAPTLGFPDSAACNRTSRVPTDMRTAFDLQCHSSFSDGKLPPAAVMEHAKADGVELAALTDHARVEGVPEAAEAARRLGMRISPAAEISAVAGVHADLHVCGYEIDVADPTLTDALEDWRADRQ